MPILAYDFESWALINQVGRSLLFFMNIFYMRSDRVKNSLFRARFFCVLSVVKKWSVIYLHVSRNWKGKIDSVCVCVCVRACTCIITQK